MNILQQKIESIIKENNNKELYLISMRYYVEDFYEAHSAVLIIDTDNENEVINLVNEFNDTSKKIIEELDKLHKYKYSLYNEYPSPTYKERMDFPKWKSGISQKEITDEMKEERNNIKKYNSKIAEENSELYNTYETKLNDLVKNYVNNSGLFKYKYEDILESTPREYTYKKINVGKVK